MLLLGLFYVILFHVVHNIKMCLFMLFIVIIIYHGSLKLIEKSIKEFIKTYKPYDINIVLRLFIEYLPRYFYHFYSSQQYNVNKKKENHSDFAGGVAHSRGRVAVLEKVWFDML